LLVVADSLTLAVLSKVTAGVTTAAEDECSVDEPATGPIAPSFFTDLSGSRPLRGWVAKYFFTSHFLMRLIATPVVLLLVCMVLVQNEL
jgi:hypothetical protein